MTPDNTATTWRDLADQLTPEQRATLEHFEQDEHMPAEILLDFARDHIDARLTDIAYADVPIPAGAKVGNWEQNTAGGWSRSLLWLSTASPKWPSTSTAAKNTTAATPASSRSIWRTTAPASPAPAPGGWPPCSLRRPTNSTGSTRNSRDPT